LRLEQPASEGDELATVLALMRDVPLFAGLPVEELADVARVMQPVQRPAGEVLWRQGQPADGLHVIVDGDVDVLLRQAGGRELCVATLGRGGVLGEVPLLDGGARSAAARTRTAVRLLFLSRADFGALTLRRNPTALAIRRRICSLVCDRLRTAYEELAASLPAAGDGGRTSAAPGRDELSPTAPAVDYVRRLAFFRDFDRRDLDELFARAALAFVARGRTLLVEGDAAQDCYITLNGAVEEAIERGDHRIPVALAGPGRAFGYLGLIDGRAAQLTATARERALLLVVPAALFADYFHGTTPASYAFFVGIERDLMTALRRKDAGFVRAVRGDG
jgi:CRP-like cAMP-binding protein